MSWDGTVTLDWADGQHNFRLGWDQLIELQEHCDAGPFVILERLSSGRWMVQEISQTIRLGLIGGGLEPAKALKLVRDYVEKRPPMENLHLARGVLLAAIQSPEDDRPGEADGEATDNGSTTSPTES